MSEEHHIGEIIPLDHSPQGAARPEQVFLPHDFVKIGRPYPIGQGLSAHFRSSVPFLAILFDFFIVQHFGAIVKDF